MLFTIVSTLRISLYIWEVCELGFSLSQQLYLQKPPNSEATSKQFQLLTQTHTPLQVCSLPCALSTNTTLESGWKLCPLRSICSPPEAAQLSMLCLSTRGSSCAERWAARRTKRQKESEERDVNVQNHSKLYICTFYNSRVKS